MAGDLPSPGDPASSFSNRDDLFGHGEWIPNPSPPLDLSSLADIDEYFDNDSMIDPEILRNQENDQALFGLGSPALNEPADKQQDDPLAGLALLKRVRSRCCAVCAYQELMLDRLLHPQMTSFGAYSAFLRLE